MPGISQFAAPQPPHPSSTPLPAVSATAATGAHGYDDDDDDDDDRQPIAPPTSAPLPPSLATATSNVASQPRFAASWPFTLPGRTPAPSPHAPTTTPNRAAMHLSIAIPSPVAPLTAPPSKSAPSPPTPPTARTAAAARRPTFRLLCRLLTAVVSAALLAVTATELVLVSTFAPDATPLSELAHARVQAVIDSVFANASASAAAAAAAATVTVKAAASSSESSVAANSTELFDYTASAPDGPLIPALLDDLEADNCLGAPDMEPQPAVWAWLPMRNVAPGVDLSTPFEPNASAPTADATGPALYPSATHFRTCSARFTWLTDDDNPKDDRSKYYHEVMGVLHADTRYYSAHKPDELRDARTNGTTDLPMLERADVELLVHDLFHSWARFADHAGVKAWLAHGSLIGWFWSRNLLPWDDDVDLQLTFRDLLRLAAEFNQTVWEERFLVDVNPNLYARFHQDHNVVDARFIDTHSGRFIDLTALASPLPSPALRAAERDSAAAAAAVNAGSTPPRPTPADWPPPPPENQCGVTPLPGSTAAIAAQLPAPRVACKSVHPYALADVFPLRPSTFMGAPAL
ncbi:hypothetical protein HK405_003913, partial [Cladochytrium tenue]